MPGVEGFFNLLSLLSEPFSVFFWYMKEVSMEHPKAHLSFLSWMAYEEESAKLLEAWRSPEKEIFGPTSFLHNVFGFVFWGILCIINRRQKHDVGRATVQQARRTRI